MAIRKAMAYSKKRGRPFTRISRNKSRSYINPVPPSKIVKFHQGSMQDFRAGKHTFVVRLLSLERVNVRDNALESCRMYLTKIMDEQALGNYYMAIKVYPHHLLRENKLSAGAGADRLSTGMSHSYGVVVGRAARVMPGQDIFVITCANEKSARIAHKALIEIKSKLPCAAQVLFTSV